MNSCTVKHVGELERWISKAKHQFTTQTCDLETLRKQLGYLESINCQLKEAVCAAKEERASFQQDCEAKHRVICKLTERSINSYGEMPDYCDKGERSRSRNSPSGGTRPCSPNYPPCESRINVSFSRRPFSMYSTPYLLLLFC